MPEIKNIPRKCIEGNENLRAHREAYYYPQFEGEGFLDFTRNDNWVIMSSTDAICDQIYRVTLGNIQHY